MAAMFEKVKVAQWVLEQFRKLREASKPRPSFSSEPIEQIEREQGGWLDKAVSEGSNVLLLGASGGGKSTLIRQWCARHKGAIVVSKWETDAALQDALAQLEAESPRTERRVLILDQLDDLLEMRRGALGELGESQDASALSATWASVKAAESNGRLQLVLAFSTETRESDRRRFLFGKFKTIDIRGFRADEARSYLRRALWPGSSPIPEDIARLVDRIVEDAGSPKTPHVPLFLELAIAALRRRGSMTLAEYVALGGVRGVVGGYVRSLLLEAAEAAHISEGTFREAMSPVAQGSELQSAAFEGKGESDRTSAAINGLVQQGLLTETSTGWSLRHARLEEPLRDALSGLGEFSAVIEPKFLRYRSSRWRLLDPRCLLSPVFLFGLAAARLQRRIRTPPDQRGFLAWNLLGWLAIAVVLTQTVFAGRDIYRSSIAADFADQFDSEDGLSAEELHALNDVGHTGPWLVPTAVSRLLDTEAGARKLRANLEPLLIAQYRVSGPMTRASLAPLSEKCRAIVAVGLRRPVGTNVCALLLAELGPIPEDLANIGMLLAASPGHLIRVARVVEPRGSQALAEAVVAGIGRGLAPAAALRALQELTSLKPESRELVHNLLRAKIRFEGSAEAAVVLLKDLPENERQGDTFAVSEVLNRGRQPAQALLTDLLSFSAVAKTTLCPDCLFRSRVFSSPDLASHLTAAGAMPTGEGLSDSEAASVSQRIREEYRTGRRAPPEEIRLLEKASYRMPAKARESLCAAGRSDMDLALSPRAASLSAKVLPNLIVFCSEPPKVPAISPDSPLSRDVAFIVLDAFHGRMLADQEVELISHLLDLGVGGVQDLSRIAGYLPQAERSRQLATRIATAIAQGSSRGDDADTVALDSASRSLARRECQIEAKVVDEIRKELREASWPACWKALYLHRCADASQWMTREASRLNSCSPAERSALVSALNAEPSPSWQVGGATIPAALLP